MAAAATGVASLLLLSLSGLAMAAVGSFGRAIWTAATRTTPALRAE